MIRLSYSFLHLFACPYASFLRYEAHLKGPTTKYLALGSAIHTALEETFPKWNLDSARNLFLKEFTRIINDEDVFITWPEVKKFEAEGINMLIIYDELLEKGKLLPPQEVEKEFEIPFRNKVVIVGKIDYLRDGIVGDYKSGKTEPDPWFLRHNLQFTTYAWAHQEIYGTLPEKLYWIHLRNGKLLETVRTQQDIDELKRMLDNALEMREKDIRYRIYHEQVCGYCDFQGDICDDRELEQSLVIKRNERLHNERQSV